MEEEYTMPTELSEEQEEYWKHWEWSPSKEETTNPFEDD